MLKFHCIITELSILVFFIQDIPYMLKFHCIIPQLFILFFYSGHSLHVKISLYHNRVISLAFYSGQSLHVKVSLYHNRVIYLVFYTGYSLCVKVSLSLQSYLSCFCYSGYSFSMLELCESGVMLSYLRNMAQSCGEHTPTILKTNLYELMKCCLGVVCGLEYLLYRKVHILYFFLSFFQIKMVV